MFLQSDASSKQKGSGEERQSKSEDGAITKFTFTVTHTGKSKDGHHQYTLEGTKFIQITTDPHTGKKTEKDDTDDFKYCQVRVSQDGEGGSVKAMMVRTSHDGRRVSMRCSRAMQKSVRFSIIELTGIVTAPVGGVTSLIETHMGNRRHTAYHHNGTHMLGRSTYLLDTMRSTTGRELRTHKLFRASARTVHAVSLLQDSSGVSMAVTSAKHTKGDMEMGNKDEQASIEEDYKDPEKAAGLGRDHVEDEQYSLGAGDKDRPAGPNKGPKETDDAEGGADGNMNDVQSDYTVTLFNSTTTECAVTTAQATHEELVQLYVGQGWEKYTPEDPVERSEAPMPKLLQKTQDVGDGSNRLEKVLAKMSTMTKFTMKKHADEFAEHNEALHEVVSLVAAGEDKPQHKDALVRILMAAGSRLTSNTAYVTHELLQVVASRKANPALRIAATTAFLGAQCYDFSAALEGIYEASRHGGPGDQFGQFAKEVIHGLLAHHATCTQEQLRPEHAAMLRHTEDDLFQAAEAKDSERVIDLLRCLSNSQHERHHDALELLMADKDLMKLPRVRAHTAETLGHLKNVQRGHTSLRPFVHDASKIVRIAAKRAIKGGMLHLHDKRVQEWTSLLQLAVKAPSEEDNDEGKDDESDDKDEGKDNNEEKQGDAEGADMPVNQGTGNDDEKAKDEKGADEAEEKEKTLYEKVKSQPWYETAQMPADIINEWAEGEKDEFESASEDADSFAEEEERLTAKLATMEDNLEAKSNEFTESIGMVYTDPETGEKHPVSTEDDLKKLEKEIADGQD